MFFSIFLMIGGSVCFFVCSDFWQVIKSTIFLRIYCLIIQSVKLASPFTQKLMPTLTICLSEFLYASA